MNIRGKIKFFFWSSILMGVATSFSAFNHFAMKDVLDTYSQSLQGPGAEDPLSQAKNALSKAKEWIPGVTNIGGDKNAEGQPPKMVYVEGRYLPYREDGIYNIDGRRVFHRDESWKRRAQAKAKADSAAKTKNWKSKTTNGVKLDSPMDAYSMRNPAKLMEAVKDAQQNVQQRNNYLEGLMDE